MKEPHGTSFFRERLWFGNSYLGSSRALDGATSRAAQLARALAWAVKRNIPLSKAVRALITNPRALAVFRVSTSLRVRQYAFHAWVPFSKLSWYMRLGSVVELLENGYPLSVALRPLRSFLPEFYFSAVQRGEKEGRLDVVLPILAEQIAVTTNIRRRFMAQSMVIASRLLASLYVLIMICLFVIPKFQELFWSMTGTAPNYQNDALELMARTGMVVGNAVLIGFVIFWFLHFFPRVKNEILATMPIIHRGVRHAAYSELGCAMTTFLSEGADLTHAAGWAEQSLPHPWLCRRLRKFLRSLERGEEWVKCWREASLGGHLDQWLIFNAGQLEDPVSGFRAMADHHHEELGRWLKRVSDWIDPVAVMLTAAVVGLVAHVTFSLLISFLERGVQAASASGVI